MKSKIGSTRRYKWHLKSAYIFPLIIFFLICTVSTFYQVNKELRTIESTIARSYNIMKNQALAALNQLDIINITTCNNELPAVMKIAGLSTYVRSVGFVENNTIYCSSISGSKKIPLSEISNEIPKEIINGFIEKSISNTHGVKSRPAIIFIKKTINDNSIFVILESQYLIDIMNLITDDNLYRIGITIGNGSQISNHNDVIKNTNKKISAEDLIEIKVYYPYYNIVNQLLYNLVIGFPFALIFSFLLANILSKIDKRKMSLPNEIENAIRDNEFYINYQPVFNVNIGSYTGAEALLRWKRPDGRIIPPDIFIKAAENDDKIIKLTKHLFDLVKKDVSSWTIPDGFHLGVNISPIHISSKNFINDVLELQKSLIKKGVKLIIEITERSMISDNDKTKDILMFLRKKGIIIAIDDFGTGYCSLSYLEEFPIDYLKIDKSFIDTIETSKSGTPILDMIISLANQIGLKIVAEGVETEYQMNYLKNSDVSFLQGYYFSPPIESSNLCNLVNNLYN